MHVHLRSLYSYYRYVPLKCLAFFETNCLNLSLRYNQAAKTRYPQVTIL